MASEMARCSACRSALSANACDRTKIAASAASTRGRNFCGSLSRSAASNSRCQCGNFMFWHVEVSRSVIGSPKCGRELDWETSFLLVLFCPLSKNAVCSALHSRLYSAVACPGAVLTRSSIVLGLARIGAETVLTKTLKRKMTEQFEMNSHGAAPEKFYRHAMQKSGCGLGESATDFAQGISQQIALPMQSRSPRECRADAGISTRWPSRRFGKEFFLAVCPTFFCPGTPFGALAWQLVERERSETQCSLCSVVTAGRMV
jgi:hypothetical protein